MTHHTHTAAAHDDHTELVHAIRRDITNALADHHDTTLTGLYSPTAPRPSVTDLRPLIRDLMRVVATNHRRLAATVNDHLAHFAPDHPAKAELVRVVHYLHTSGDAIANYEFPTISRPAG